MLLGLAVLVVIAAGAAVFRAYEAARFDISETGHWYGEVFWRVGNTQHRIETARIQLLHYIDKPDEQAADDALAEMDFLYMELGDALAMTDLPDVGDTASRDRLLEFQANLDAVLNETDAGGLNTGLATAFLNELTSFSGEFSEIRVALASDHSGIAERFSAGFLEVTRLFVLVLAGALAVVCIAAALAFTIYRGRLDRMAAERSEQSRRLEIIGAMAQGFAHAINSTIAAARGGLDRITRDLDSKAQADVDAITASLNRLGTVSRDLQDLSEGDRAAQRLDLVREVKLILAEWDTDAKLKHNGEAVHVNANSQVIEIVLDEMITNAVAAQADNPRVEVRVEASRYAVELVVRDFGAGVPDHLSARIFEPFFSTRSDSHSGLGLARLKTLLETLGGGLSFRNLPDGCEFIARFRPG